jgi:trans-2,3-dihydro-3-hydroxyanthranilate isomerase
VKNQYFNSSEINIIAGQGYEIGRPSQLKLQANENNNKIEIHVGGKVHLVAEGNWL